MAKHKKIYLLIAIAIFAIFSIIFIFSKTVWADTLILQPNGDAGLDARIINGSHANTNYGTDIYLSTHNNGNDNIQHTIIKFDLSSIPAGSTINSAELYLTHANNYSHRVRVGRMTADWDETQVTWNNSSTGVSWENPGGDYEGTYADEGSAVTGDVSLDTTSLVQLWVDGTYPNYGYCLRDDDTNTGILFWSSDYSGASSRPKLTIDYTPPSNCDSSSHNVVGWGWSDYTGWISLSCANEEAPSDVDYGVNVDTGSGNVTGYAWNGWGSNSGEGYWVCFGSTCSGTPPTGSLSANYDSSTGQITGWAKFVGWGDDGWIKLSADDLSWGTKYFGSASGGTFGEDSADPASSWAWNDKIGWIKWVPTSCTCDDWVNDVCGGDSCSPGKMHQTRTCTPDGCDPLGESQCVNLTEDCTDDKDTDCDGCDDNADSDCGKIETSCTDGIDNDCDGAIDCEDLDCGCATPPDAPINLSATSNRCGVIDLSWDAVSDADSYNIYKTLSPNGCDDLTAETCYNIASGITAINYSDTAVIPRIDYYYRVTSFKTTTVSNPTPPPDTITQELESVPSDYSSARTVCFPGSEWEER